MSDNPTPENPLNKFVLEEFQADIDRLFAKYNLSLFGYVVQSLDADTFSGNSGFVGASTLFEISDAHMFQLQQKLKAAANEWNDEIHAFGTFTFYTH